MKTKSAKKENLKSATKDTGYKAGDMKTAIAKRKLMGVKSAKSASDTSPMISAKSANDISPMTSAKSASSDVKKAKMYSEEKEPKLDLEAIKNKLRLPKVDSTILLEKKRKDFKFDTKEYDTPAAQARDMKEKAKSKLRGK